MMSDVLKQGSDLVNRLRGIYITPVNDGAGLLDGKATVTRKFDNLPPIMAEAADEIERLSIALSEAQSLAERYLREREQAKKMADRLLATAENRGRIEGAAYAEQRAEAIRGLLAHLPELWGDNLYQGELVLLVDGTAIDAALAALANDQRQGADSPYVQAPAKADQISNSPPNKVDQSPCEPEPTHIAQSAPATNTTPGVGVEQPSNCHQSGSVSQDAFNALSRRYGEVFGIAESFRDTLCRVLDTAERRTKAGKPLEQDEIDAMTARLVADTKELYGEGRPVAPHTTGHASGVGRNGAE